MPNAATENAISNNKSSPISVAKSSGESDSSRREIGRSATSFAPPRNARTSARSNVPVSQFT
jgi:hypothetical protein